MALIHVIGHDRKLFGISEQRVPCFESGSVSVQSFRYRSLPDEEGIELLVLFARPEQQLVCSLKGIVWPLQDMRLYCEILDNAEE
jgi:hypothetical protein